MVNILWYFTDGSPVTEIDWGDVGVGSTTIPREFYCQHDGINPVAECGYYLDLCAGYYDGAYNRPQDHRSLISWGDKGAYGLMINQNKAADYPTESWQSFNSSSGKNPTSVISLSASSIVGSGDKVDGQLRPGQKAYQQLKISVPSNTILRGGLIFTHRLIYTYTS